MFQRRLLRFTVFRRVSERQRNFYEIAEEFLTFIKGKKIIIHNAPFDLSFLDGELGFIKKGKIDKSLVMIL